MRFKNVFNIKKHQIDFFSVFDGSDVLMSKIKIKYENIILIHF